MYTIQDLIDASVEEEPVKVQAAFDHLIGQKVMDALEIRKREIASNMFKDQEENTDDEDNYAEDEDTQSA
jgi:hypothetical protein